MDGKHRFEKNMRRILRSIIKGDDLKELSSYDLECLYECVERGYLIGITADRNANGEPIHDVSHLTIKYRGYYILKKKANTAKIMAITDKTRANASLLSMLIPFLPPCGGFLCGFLAWVRLAGIPTHRFVADQAKSLPKHQEPFFFALGHFGDCLAESLEDLFFFFGHYNHLLTSFCLSRTL